MQKHSVALVHAEMYFYTCLFFFSTDLFILPLSGFDIILGIN